ncbi:ABC transporter substrate-binding protein [Paenibacillus hunanensis]|uniref:ABC-type glycerol-3-phosphate transport system substrate-binding protein n=1 Tax=Paenibacillus hunanensis TaxID=539262 RepID=A0ABU1ISW1_9BACL|nr:sugar ABC transporter substrate-binding protein [Paenibacillus hunanensis]MDR6242342.1 ABC-type glycerol-3-phosphate transport system substrate-binding protein [Paenibacillus hunanensis]GGJ07110.1 sugar ABC transporter substrate-binding protein [Paenibacillus hunanensis]
MKLTKAWKLTIVAGVVLSLLAGCSSGSSSSNGASSSSNESAVTTLNFWAALDPSTDQGKEIQQQITQFNNEHKDVQVNMQVISYDVMHQKLIAAVTAGDAPDMTWGLGEWFGELNQMDALADLTPYVDKWTDKDKLYPNIMQGLTIDGKVKALPNYIGIRALLYHDNLLKQAGYNAPPKTWDELLKMGPVIKQKTGKYAFGISASGVRSSQELMTYLAQNDVQLVKDEGGGKYKNTWQEDSDQMKKATQVFQFYKDLLSSNTIDPNGKTWGWEEEDQNFVLAQYAMVVNGSWIEGRTNENPEGMKDVKIAPPPYGSKPATFLEIAPLYLYKSDHLDKTWEFASFLMSKEYQSKVNPSSAPRSDAITGAWGKQFMELTSQGVNFPPISLGGITQAMQDSLARLMLQNDSPEAVAAWLGQAINDSLKASGQLSGS